MCGDSLGTRPFTFDVPLSCSSLPALQPPIPPQSLVLHLGVTARTYSIPDYVLLFDNFDSFYINQHALGADVPASLPKGESTHPQELRVKSEEKEMLLCVLSQMIRCAAVRGGWTRLTFAH